VEQSTFKQRASLQAKQVIFLFTVISSTGDYRKFQVGCPHDTILKYELTNRI